jgi:predicted nuclease with RNAse H fold
MRALGIDVSKSRGLDLVLMAGSGEILDTRRRVQPLELPGIVAEAEPEVVAIDSPPTWGKLGSSRLTERELRRFGIQSYGTPSDPKRADNAFYDWMRIGMEAFAEVAAQFPRYRSGSVRGTSIEAFPHATAVVLADCLPPANVKKHVWRRSILRAHKIAEEELRSADQVDAALAAYTGVLALRGKFTALGDPLEGLIVLPVRTLPAAPYRRCIQPPEPDPQLHLPGLTPCGCGDPGCTKVTRAEFARGHEAKRKSWLWKQARLGEEAAQELKRRKWELPPELRS